MGMIGVVCLIGKMVSGDLSLRTINCCTRVFIFADIHFIEIVGWRLGYISMNSKENS